MDAFKNRVKVTVSTGYNSAATSIVLNGGDGAKLPAVPFNAVWWNFTDYSDPSDDANAEIIRVTAVSTDTLTITRAQEGDTATNKNTGGKVYKLIVGLTAKTFNTDIPALIPTADSLSAAEVSVASAATVDLGAQTSQLVAVTGTVTITSFGTIAAGIRRWVRFTGALTLTHNATSLIIPGAGNITTAANDRMFVVSLGSGNWRVYFIQKADNSVIVGDGSGGTIVLPSAGDGFWLGSNSSGTESISHVASEGTGNVVRRSLLDGICYFEFALSDEVTAITTGTAKVTWRAPFAFTVVGVRASLTAASSSGIPTVDINEAGTTILSTKLTVDASELTSTTAAAAAVISDSAIADDAEITFDIDVAGTNAKGLKVKIYYTKP